MPNTKKTLDSLAWLAGLLLATVDAFVPNVPMAVRSHTRLVLASPPKCLSRDVSATATTVADAGQAVCDQRRKVMGLLGAGAGAGLGLVTRADAAMRPPSTSSLLGAPVPEQDEMRPFCLPMKVGLGTCCPCNVRGEEDALGGDDDEDEGGGRVDSACEPTYTQVSDGISAGYTFIDTASHYNNEASVGQALVDAVGVGSVARKDVTVCTKVWFDDLGFDKTLTAVKSSNERLLKDQGGGADLVLIHFPGTIDSVQSPAKNKRLRKESWEALEKLKLQGQVRGIGVSNYVRRHMKELLSTCTMKPDVVEMEIHPFNQQPELVKLCKDNGIQVIGFSPLAHGDLPVLKNKVLVEIASAHDKSVAQVVVRWMLQESIIPIIKTMSPQRMAENIDVDDFVLSDDDMNKIRNLDAGKRVGFDPNLIA